MWTRALLTLSLLLVPSVFWSPPVQAGCVVETTGTYAEGANLRDDKCDIYGNKKVTAGYAPSGGTATAAAPTLAEASTGYFSWDLSGNLRVTLGTCLSGESACLGLSPNSYMMIVGGVPRPGTLMTGVTTNTTSATATLYSGSKTFLASVTGTGAVSVTVNVFGDMQNTTTNGQWLCTISPSGTTTDTKACLNQITKDFPYYHAVTTSISGTGATVEVIAVLGIAGIKEDVYQTSGVKTADALIKTGPGFLRCILIAQHDAAPTAGTISINDATSAGTGTVIFEWVLTTAVFTPIQVCPETPFTTGLYFDFTTTADVNVSGTFR